MIYDEALRTIEYGEREWGECVLLNKESTLSLQTPSQYFFVLPPYLCIISILGNCQAERIVFSLNEVYTFHTRNLGESYPFTCIHGQTDEAKSSKRPPILLRACVLSEDNEGVWEPLDVSTCRHHSQGSKQLQDVDYVCFSVLHKSKIFLFKRM